MAVALISQAQDKLLVNTAKEEIIIDGIIEDLWTSADSVSSFIQLEPEFGAESSRKTVVSVLQVEKDLYFLFKCYIESPEEVVATVRQRDRLNLRDDGVSILLDTYLDHHSAFLFQVNPLGTLSDAKVTGDGNDVDDLWDTEWEAKTALYEKYWVAEVKIPLKSLQFKTNTRSWGCNFSRSIRNNQEIVWWQKLTENYRVSQSGRLDALTLDQKKVHKLDLFPYATLRYEDSDLTGNHNTFKGDAGLDIEYKYGSNLKTNIAINPDFATVEGDKEQINLTPWETKFPEKRLFFQNGNEMFDTRIQSFYSRRIGDIQVGDKMMGKIGKYQFNALFAQTKEGGEDINPSKFGAFRLKRDFLKASTLGFTYTSKFVDTTAFHTFSGDYNLNLGKEWKLTGQYVASLPGDLKSHSAWFVRFAKENNTYHYHVRYTDLGENFKDNVNQTGFIQDDDRKEIDSDITYKFWYKNTLKYISLAGKNNIFWSQEGDLRSWYLTYIGRFFFENKFSLDLKYNNEYKNAFRGVFDDFYNHYYKAVIGYNSDENEHIHIGWEKGMNFNRNYDLIEMHAAYQLFKKVNLSYEYKYIHFNPDPEDETTHLNILSLSYYHSKDLWLRVFTQHNYKKDRIYFYGLTGWRFKPPFGALYLIYSSDNYSELLSEEIIRSNIFFVKVTYPLSFSL